MDRRLFLMAPVFFLRVAGGIYAVLIECQRDPECFL
jgi:hypothetical protein